MELSVAFGYLPSSLLKPYYTNDFSGFMAAFQAPETPKT